MNLSTGQYLQNRKYRLANVIGQGGFGITYKGVWYTEVKGALGKMSTEVPICIKEFFFKDYCYRHADSRTVQVHSETGQMLFGKFKEKLIKEARILSEVHHPFIVNVLEVFEENNTAYIVMEYLPGSSLKQKMDIEGILPEARVLRYLRQIGEALQFVHEKSILHLDIKPSNIIVDKDDNARLIDFGVSKRYDDIEQQETSTTMLTLSKGFASIEQYDGEGIVNFSPRPDIYSLGATLYNLLTGKIPVESILRATKPLVNPRELNPAISPKTEEAILKAMQITPEDRYESVREFMEALDLPPLDESDSIQKRESSNGTDEETTLLLSDKEKKGDKDHEDEATVYEPEMHERKRKGMVIPFLVFMFTVLASAGVLLVYTNIPASGMRENPDQNSILADNLNEQLGEKITQEPEETTTIPDNNGDGEAETLPETVATTLPANRSEANTPPKRTEPAVVNRPETTGSSSVTEPTMDEAAIDARYEELLLSGKSKKEAMDYSGAKADLEEARRVKLTEEVVRLLISNDALLEQQRLTDRKKQYEERMAFGGLMIVKKISTGKYGAIDSSADEVIPCNYVFTGNTEGGRSFEREDGLFDIYNEKGVLITAGANHY